MRAGTRALSPASLALAQATRSGRRAIDDFAADHGRDNTRLANGLERYRKDVLRQDGEIRQLARLLLGAGLTVKCYCFFCGAASVSGEVTTPSVSV
jgi:hypothetical protein